MKNVIGAEVVQMAQVTLEYHFLVKITAPVEVQPLIYKISFQEVMMRSYSGKSTMSILYELLHDRILHDYNRLVEDSPIMDMFADPIKYELASSVDLKLIRPEEIRPSFIK